MTIFFGDEPVKLGNGIVGKPWQVETGNPTHFYQAISAPGDIEPATIYAQTFLPKAADSPGAVIVVPGSMGVADSHLHKAELLTDAGIAACVLDPFGARGVSSTVANQAQYSFAASAWDLLATAEQLAASGDLASAKIGAQGHSRGGSAVLAAAVMLRLTSFSQPLAGVYAAYPWCGMQFLNPLVGSAKVRSIIGDRDEWCLPQQVQGSMHAMQLTGADASWRLVPGAHHSFDRATGLELIEDASVAPGAPTIYIQDDGACIHPTTGKADPQADERSLMMYGIKAGYGRQGARIGTQENYASLFHEDMMAFWTRVLGSAAG